jgi:hypothetical protein
MFKKRLTALTLYCKVMLSFERCIAYENKMVQTFWLVLFAGFDSGSGRVPARHLILRDGFSGGGQAFPFRQ